MRLGDGGLRPAHAIFGLPLLDDGLPDALPSLGVDPGSGPRRRGIADPPLPALRLRDGDDTLGQERPRLARRSRRAPDRLIGPHGHSWTCGRRYALATDR